MFVLLGILFLNVLLIFLPIAPVLIITAEETAKDFVMARNGQQIILEYTHSLTNNQVKDYFKIEKGKLFLTSIHTKDYAEGFPAFYPKKIENDWLVYEIKPPIPIDPLTIQIGYKMNPIIFTDKQSISLVCYFGKGNVVGVSPGRINYISKWANL